MGPKIPVPGDEQLPSCADPMVLLVFLVFRLFLVFLAFDPNTSGTRERLFLIIEDIQPYTASTR